MILTSFFHYLQFEKRYSGHTLLAYQSDLKQFLAYLKKEFEEKDLLQVQSQWIRSWIFELMSKGLKPRTIHRKISSLSSFYSFALEQGATKNNPMDRVVLPRQPKALPVHYQRNTIQQLLEILPEPVDYSSVRDRCIIYVLLGCGLRRSELIQIEKEHIDFDQSRLQVLGKGNKSRLVPLHATVKRELRNLISFLEQLEQEKRTNLIFLTDNGNPLYPKFVYNLVKRYLTGVTTAERRNPHSLRHSFATELLNEGADLSAIKDLLGHAGLKSTEVYTHTSVDRLKSAYLNAHPRSTKSE